MSHFSAHMSIRGNLLAGKGHAGALADIRVEGTTRDQFLRTTGFGAPGCVAVYRPNHVCIEGADGSVLMQRNDPRASFEGHIETTKWDRLHLAYVNGYANWENFTAPFLMAGPGFQTEELAPWQENGETWRRLFVWFPQTIATHSSQQTFYFDPDGLPRRIDYCCEIAGGIEVSHYCTDHTNFSGITLPMRRRVLRRDAKGNVAPAPVIVDISISDATFW